MSQLLSEHSFNGGSASALTLDDALRNTFAPGSRNQLTLGQGVGGGSRPWKGMQSKGAGTGIRKLVQVNSTWGGLKDISTLQGAGSLFSDIGQALFFIGGGQVSIEGVDLAGLIASTNLQVSISVAGVYSAATTYDCGLPQSSAPDCAILTTPGAGNTGQINGPVSFKIARVRLSTGGRSIASAMSAVLVPANQSIRITFPLPSDGQDTWRVFSTQEGFGGIGLAYALKYGSGSSAVLDIPESVVAAGVVDGVTRSLEFDFKTGDLIPELAYIDDYPPPAGTHAVRLENVMVVLGAFSDSVSAVTTTDTGTVGACSLPNFYESYKPSHRVYFPEQIVDHRARATDSYAYVAGRNSITALQYVGLRDGPAVALTMVIPDSGIARACNWTQVQGLLYMRIANGGFVRMKSDGALDYQWAAPIFEAVKDWDDSTVVSWHPNTMSVVIMNGRQAWSFCLLNEEWSPVCYFGDAGVAGVALSAINSVGEMIVSVNNGGSHTAYSWDQGATKMPITSMTPWTQARVQQVSKAVQLEEMEIAFETDRITDPMFISLHRNMRRPSYVIDAATTNGSARIDSVSAVFDANHVLNGDMVLLSGADVGGAGVDYLMGIIASLAAPNGVNIIDPITGNPLLAQATRTACYMTIAHQIFPYTMARIGSQHSEYLQEPSVLNAQSYALGFHLITNATAGQIIKADVAGSPDDGGMGVVT